jgi:predicted DNA-binding WGR domain protein
MTQSVERRSWYLELIAGNHFKFYRVTVVGRLLTTHWGRIGTAGQMQVKEFSNFSAATFEAGRKMREKLAKGYRNAEDPQESAQPSQFATHQAMPVVDDEPPLRKDEKVLGSSSVVMFLD